MNNYENNAYFWQKIDNIIINSNFRLVYPKGSRNEEMDEIIYPYDYGIYFDDANGLNTYHAHKHNDVSAIAVCVDIINKSFDVKILVGMEEEDFPIVMNFLNSMGFQKAVLLKRENTIPDWLNLDA